MVEPEIKKKSWLLYKGLYGKAGKGKGRLSYKIRNKFFSPNLKRETSRIKSGES